jgi:hypothetical protein
MPDFFDDSAFDGEVDWVADEAAGIDTRTRMEYGKVYRKLDQSYCSSCGVDSVIRNDLVNVLRRNSAMELGQGWSLCPEHFAKWSGREELTEAEQIANRKNLQATVCMTCYTQRSASGACLCD